MAKHHTTFVCQNCGAVYNRWKGRCEACGGWNTHRRGDRRRRHPLAGPSRRARAAPRAACSRSRASPARRTRRRASPSGIAELDRVTGGGFVRGSVLLVGGDPGIGKSTLLMQACRRARRARAIASSTSRARRRSRRCGCAPSGSGLGDAPVELAAETNVEDILATLAAGRAAGARRSSIRSRPCGPRPSNRRPARSPRCAARAGADPLRQDQPARR